MLQLSGASLSDLIEQTVGAVVQVVGQRRTELVSTYRLQFHAGFTFRDAAAIVPYLRELGVSHVYASPYLRARAGSTHGYDVCDYNHLNPELGDDNEYHEFVEALKSHGLSQILDVVPNHMAASQENSWWRDVLENGPNSPYSGYFDIDWRPVKDELESKVLIPILGAQYGDVLESGQLTIEHNEGGFQIRYFDRALPVGPKSVIPLLNHHLEHLRERLGADSESFVEYQSIVTALEHLPPPTATTTKAVHERQREKEVIKRRLRDLEAREPAVAEFVFANTELFNGRVGDPESFGRLDKLLQMQSYRLCHWRAASDEINFRRFFDVNDLAALCVEKPEVFQAVHTLIGRLLCEEQIAGLRIDHVDGLYSPEEYLWRLQWLYLAQLAFREFNRSAQSAADSLLLSVSATIENEPDTLRADSSVALAESPIQQTLHLGPEILRRTCRRLNLRLPDEADLTAIFGPRGAEISRHGPRWDLDSESNVNADETAVDSALQSEKPLYVVVEKILGPDEPLPENWPVAGTTGYDYTHFLNGLFVVPEGLAEIERQFRRFTGEKRTFADIVHDCKRLILRFSMSSELQMLAHRVNRISEQHRKSRDFTLNALRYALREVLAAFSVYRTYPGPGGISERDQQFVNRAVAVAKRRNRAMDPTTYDFIRDVLLLRHPPGLSADAIRSREEFAGRFQQVTSPTMAKGVEDTAFYVYFPLLSTNEVGSSPAAPPVKVAAFHQQNLQRSIRQRGGLLATTTHDTKRSEDVRARINVLTEIPDRWRAAVQAWSRLTRRWKKEVDGALAPSREDEYLFYQSLIGVWPTYRLDEAGHAELVARMQIYMEKATHEAKQRTSWINPHTEYDQAVRQFIAQCLDRSPENRFLAAFEPFQRKIASAGIYTAASQTTLKFMSPGVPDIYQGQEIWDYSLVDPDNRRPVDYVRRAALLEQVKAVWNTQAMRRHEFALSLAQTPEDERLKLFITWRLLAVRRQHPEIFSDGCYQSLESTGPASEHIVAFAWSNTSTPKTPQLVVLVPRWWQKLAEAAGLDDSTQITSAAKRVWQDTQLVMPSLAGRYRNVFSDCIHEFSEPSLKLDELLQEFPVAVLVQMGESS